MRTVALSILLAAAAAFVPAANAQATAAPGPESYAPVAAAVYSPPTDSPPSRWDDDFSYLRYDIRYGVGALKAQDYAEAEEIFTKLLRGKQDNADANFYMGVTKMNLGKWEDAKQYLEIAARKKPKHPDPKSRLGVTYAKLGDMAGATAQRADLVKMADACKGACRLSPYITGGIEMIDEALAEPRLSSP